MSSIHNGSLNNYCSFAEDDAMNKNEYASSLHRDIGNKYYNMEQLSLPAMTPTIVGICAMSRTTENIDAPTNSAGGDIIYQQQRQSTFISQEASSIFDRALEIHAAPMDDPPIRGDDFGDFSEVADILEGIEDITKELEAFDKPEVQGAFNCSDVANNRGGLDFLMDEKSSSTQDQGAQDPKNTTEESSSVYKNRDDVDCSTHRISRVEPMMPDHDVTNQHMDERVFEDIFPGDELFSESYNSMGGTSDTSFGCRDIFDEPMPQYGSPPDNTAFYAETSSESMSQRRSLLVGSQPPLTPYLQRTEPPLPIVTPPRMFDSTHDVIGPSPGIPVIHPSVTLQPPPSEDYIFLRQRISTSQCISHQQVVPSAVRLPPYQPICQPKAESRSDAAWKRRFLELEDFIRKHGHSNVPQKYENNPSLGAWVARQRLIMRQWEDNQKNAHATDEKSLLTGERVERLKSIGLERSIGKGAFGRVCTRNTNEWEKQFDDLVKYKAVHGNCNVPTKCTSLGRWVANQRKKYRQFHADDAEKMQDLIGWSEELRNRFQRLHDVGFSFFVGKGNAQQKKSC